MQRKKFWRGILRQRKETGAQGIREKQAYETAYAAAHDEEVKLERKKQQQREALQKFRGKQKGKAPTSGGATTYCISSDDDDDKAPPQKPPIAAVAETTANRSGLRGLTSPMIVRMVACVRCKPRALSATTNSSRRGVRKAQTARGASARRHGEVRSIDYGAYAGNRGIRHVDLHGDAALQSHPVFGVQGHALSTKASAYLFLKFEAPWPLAFII